MNGLTTQAINGFVAEHYPGTSNRCEAVGDDWAVSVQTVDPAYLRPGQIISGPTVFGVCDAALWFACFTAIGIEAMALTSEMSIRFLRPARGDVIRARAQLLDVGRRTIVGSIVAWTDDESKPVAVAQGSYVRPRESGR